MTLSRYVAAAIVAFGLIQLDGRVEAGIANLYNTGVDGSGNPLANGAVDSHYREAYQASSSVNFSTLAANSLTYAFNPTPATYPIPPWTPNGAASTWISANPSIGTGTQDPNGYYIYKTTFTVTDPIAGLSISGKFTADDRVAVLLNPIGTVDVAGLAFTPDEGYASFYNFSINGGFLTGSSPTTNTLYFVVQNTHSAPEGLRVEFNAVPEPASLAMLGLGLVGVAGVSRHRRTRGKAVASA